MKSTNSMLKVIVYNYLSGCDMAHLENSKNAVKRIVQTFPTINFTKNDLKVIRSLLNEMGIL
jgi:hypothetical protein